MKILVISDTHGSLERVYDVFSHFPIAERPQVIVHCGDFYKDALEIAQKLPVSVVCVKGNCDGSFSEDDYSFLDTEAGRFLVTHGHMNSVDLSMQNLYYAALEKECIGVLFGHTHRSIYTKVSDIYLMNPGSLSKPRDGLGGSFGLLDISNDSIWGKIYSYEDFMSIPKEDFSAAKNKTGQKPKVTGGKLRSMINYSDRF